MAVEVATIVERMQTAGRNWEAALDAHALAPPDRNFPSRLRQLASAAAEETDSVRASGAGRARVALANDRR